MIYIFTAYIHEDSIDNHDSIDNFEEKFQAALTLFIQICYTYNENQTYKTKKDILVIT